jgi:hypothetical protein
MKALSLVSDPRADLGGRSQPASLEQPVALIVAALVAAVVGRGGFFLVPRVVVSLLLGAALVSGWRSGRLRLTPLLLAGLAGLASWGLVAGLVAGDPVGALAPAATLAGFGVVVAVVGGASRIQRDLVAAWAIGLGALAALSGWAGVAFRASPWAHVDGGLWRAATTVTYANAAAAVLAALTLLALGGLGGRPARQVAMSRLTVTLLMVGLAATLSRAGIAGFALGWVVLAALAGLKPALRATIRPSAGALIAMAALVVSMPAADPGRPAIALIGLAAGLAVGALPWPRQWARWPLMVGAVAVVAGGVVIAASGHTPKFPSLWSDRAGWSSPDRNGANHAAVSQARSHVMFGVGPGRTTLIWTTADHKLVLDHYVHDEYLQLAMEQGLPALLLLGVIAAGLVQLIARGRRREGAGSANHLMWAGAVAGVLGIVLHGGFDFLWHVPAVVLVAALLVGLASSPDVPVTNTNNQEET